MQLISNSKFKYKIFVTSPTAITINKYYVVVGI